MQFLKYGFLFLAFFLGCALQGKSSDSPVLVGEDDELSGEKVERVLIHLKNVTPGNRSIPGSNGIVKLERRRYRQQSQTLDDMASFYDVPADQGYTVTGMHQTEIEAFDNPVELWGMWKDVEISTQRNELSLVRNMPYVLDVRASYQRNNTANPSLQEGEELVFDVLLRNPSGENFKTRVVLLLKNALTGEIHMLEKEYMLNAFERRASADFRFTAEVAGEYHFATGVFVKQRINQWTDCWDWSANPFFYVTTEHRTLEFSGYSWDVKAGFGNPGNNLWSNDTSDVWVDDAGRLNLTLAPKDNGKWYATEIISQETFGYGTFTFFLDAEPETYDPHVVAAIFLYKNEESEIDIEFSRWGDQENYEFGNYVIQPADVQGNLFQFPILTSGSYTTHRITWKPDEVLFSSWHGHYNDAPEGRIIAQWQYAGKNIPDSNGIRLFFNIWLFRGIYPKSDKTERFTISHFTYEPLF